MSPLSSLEQRLRQLIEGAFQRVSAGGVQPVDLARAAEQELLSNRLIGVSGTFAPNVFRLTLSAEDWARLEPFTDTLVAETEAYLQHRAEDLGAHLVGDIRVELAGSQAVKAGQLSVVSAAEHTAPREADAPTGSGACFRVIRGARRGETIPLPDTGAVLGRDPDCDFCLTEPSASRRHAEVRSDGQDFLLRDLDSTNGTLVNNRPVAEHRLQVGDLVAIGATVMEFQRVHTV